MPQGVVRYDPFDELARLQRDMNRLFESSYESSTRTDGRNEGLSAQTWAPRVDITEDTDQIAIHAEVPGVHLEDIEISMTNDTLTLSGERRFEGEEQRAGYVRIERAYGRFTRTFNVGIPVDSEKIEATLKDGVLTIRLAKSPEIRPKKIPVTTG